MAKRAKGLQSGCALLRRGVCSAKGTETTGETRSRPMGVSDPRRQESQMNRFRISVIFVVLFLSSPITVLADLKVITAKESDLPFELSASRFSNSPSKFSNSVSKFSNSPSKFSNSPSKFDNSPSRYENGRSGNRRLLLEQEANIIYIGYYVRGDDGLMNFFSSNGTRMFYSPSDTDALFGGENGEFCGTLATLNGEKVLVLTEMGQLAFMKEGVSLSSQPAGKPSDNPGSSSGGSSGHWIQENIDSGSMMVLEDGSIWKIDPLDKVEAMLWLPFSNITIVPSNDGSPGYDYLLINTDDGEKAHAKYLGRR